MSPSARFQAAVLAAAIVLVFAIPAAAQDEAALRSFFEGRRVTLKIDMPATADGVDVRSGEPRPLDYKVYGERIKKNGTAIKSGETAVVTFVRVKKNLIEFQLSGGGFGTASDNTGTSVNVPSVSKTRREEDLERALRSETDAAKKKALERELNDLRNARSAQNSLLMLTRAQTELQMKMQVADQRLKGGSRFNLRYSSRVPDGVTPQAVMAALADYVEFFSNGPNFAAAPLPVVVALPLPVPGPIATPYKGMPRAGAEQAFGRPVETAARREGALTVTTLVFVHAGRRISAEFVEDVLIRYTEASR